MKIPYAKSSPSSQSGMTLIELTVVILVLLSLIAVTFVGANAWKRGSDRSMAILLIRSAQVGLRSHCQMSGIDAESFPDLPDHVFGPERFVSNGVDRDTGIPKGVGELPDHPSPSKFFDFVAGDGDIIPPFGELYICTGGSAELNDLRYNPQPSVYEYW